MASNICITFPHRRFLLKAYLHFRQGKTVMHFECTENFIFSRQVQSHRLQTKLWEGNVFTGVCLSTGAGSGYLWYHVPSSSHHVRMILEYFLVYVNLYDHLSNMAIFGHFVYQLQRINKIGLTTDMFTKTIPGNSLNNQSIVLISFFQLPLLNH